MTICIILPPQSSFTCIPQRQRAESCITKCPPRRWMVGRAHTRTTTHTIVDYATEMGHAHDFLGSWSAEWDAPLPPSPPPLPLALHTPTTFHHDVLLVRGMGPNDHINHDGTVFVLGDVHEVCAHDHDRVVYNPPPRTICTHRLHISQQLVMCSYGVTYREHVMQAATATRVPSCSQQACAPHPCASAKPLPTHIPNPWVHLCWQASTKSQSWSSYRGFPP